MNNSSEPLIQLQHCKIEMPKVQPLLRIYLKIDFSGTNRKIMESLVHLDYICI